MFKSLCFALDHFTSNAINPDEWKHFNKPKTSSEGLFKARKWLSSQNVKVSLRDLKKVVKKNAHTSDPREIIYTTTTSYFFCDELYRRDVLNVSDYVSEIKFLCDLMNRKGHSGAVCDVNLEDAYPVTMNKPDKVYPLRSPLQILKTGRKEMHWLVQKSAAEVATHSPGQPKEPLKWSQLYNSKMLEKVNEIRKNSLSVCTLLLGAFMEEQIRVPLVKTSFDTARAIEIASSAVAVGVWALFSLTFGDVQAMISAIPSRSHILVEVKEYIKGIFKQDTATADKNYAGKLQFMTQGMSDSETVSCNSHYVSYSLERQLIELCLRLKINESTPLENLISDWDQIFKDNVMSFVVPTHRSLIARWLKWALMIHHLREELARSTAVGVVGLVNSGKSLLVSTLFDIKVCKPL